MSYRYSADELLAGLQALADELGRPPSQQDMDDHGPHASKTYHDRFGGWNDALAAAGLSTDMKRSGGRPPIPEPDLIAELHQLAETLGKAPSMRNMEADGAYAPKTYLARFGSWNAALREAGFEPNIRLDIPKEEALKQLRTFADELGRTPTSEDMTRDGPYSRKLYERKFGSWNNALQAAGLPVHDEWHVETAALLSELRRLASHLDRVHRRVDMVEHGEYSGTVYFDRFGSWRDALKAAGMAPHEHYNVSRHDLVSDLQGLADELERAPFRREIHQYGTYSLHWYYKTFGSIDHALRQAVPDDYGERLWQNYLRSNPPDGANWTEMREKALRRDRYRCVRCGTTQAEHRQQTGFDLHVHHRKPRQWFLRHPEKRIEDANDLDNLLTVCATCHRIVETLSVQPRPPSRVS